MSETITRLCGCDVEFTPRGDQWDDARRQKLVTKNCPACGRLKNEADNRAAAANPAKSKKVKKGQEIKMLPAGTRIELVRQADGRWVGIITCSDTTIESSMGGAMGLVNKLARQLLTRSGVKLTGKVVE